MNELLKKFYSYDETAKVWHRGGGTSFSYSDGDDTENSILDALQGVADRSMLGGQTIAQAIQRPLVESFMSHQNRNDEVQLDEFEVTDASPLVGKSLAEAALTKQDVIILAIKNAASPILQQPRAKTVLRAGDVLLAAGAKANLQALHSLM